MPPRNACTRAEGVCRGYRSGLLTVADYNNLSQCESLDDIKLNLVRCALAPRWLARRTCRREMLCSVPHVRGGVSLRTCTSAAPPNPACCLFSDGIGLWELPGERGVAALHHDRGGAVHAEAGERLELHENAGGRQVESAAGPHAQQPQPLLCAGMPPHDVLLCVLALRLARTWRCSWTTAPTGT